ncbi:cation diffusion facilitator family transporter [Rhizobium sp. L1K21]|uniref:cation diffusion facilitator family transporter n=1 Tax=Rhizobium sp. L1K21 TaxID=2954933 RepID=UPI002093DC6D|nr:cation diffusion facilitator family transporter [Rhizobium sp. L1K21]MCO6187845.1 cation diffusion facilitator family transporter [Rhizobium sp. L1K21]
MPHQHGSEDSSDSRIIFALVINLALTAVQIVAGLFAGSLALVADAMHNFSDAMSIGITFAARRIARRPADETMTFGYGRAEVVAALINYTTLIVIGLYLVYEAVTRFFDPGDVGGWTMVIVAAVAAVIDLATVFLTYSGSRHSMNIRSTFLHNLADVFGSLGVIAGGVLVIVFKWTVADPLITLAIAAYILWQAFREIIKPIRLLVLAVPEGINGREVVETIKSVPGVSGLHHLHLWSINEHEHAVEAHIETDQKHLQRIEQIKSDLRQALKKNFGIEHTTFEFEDPADTTCEASKTLINQRKPLSL